MEEDKQKEHPPFFKSVRNYFREYCNCSSIHGFRYFGEKRTYFERAWWFIVFSVTFAGCIIAIREVYHKWVMSPVIVSFATKETPIYSIPFPAVTICPESKAIQKKYNHTHMLRKFLEEENITAEEQKLIDYMAMICNRNVLFKYSHNDTFDTDDFFEELTNISYNSYESTFLSCDYMGEEIDCREFFKPIVTDEGICFTFNMLEHSEIYRKNVVLNKQFYPTNNLTSNNDWSMEKGYSDEAGLDTYPSRALLAGAKNSLTLLLLTTKSNIDHVCKEAIHGFRVLLHIPSRIPRPSQQYFMVPLNQVTIGAIQPAMITTSESVKLYNPKRRECYFTSEKTLKYFKIYTSLNCKLECLTNYTLQRCGCVKYYMPRNKTTKICGTGKWRCMVKAEEILQWGNLQHKIKEPANSTNEFSGIPTHIPDCDCMPICTDLAYNVEISQNTFDWLNWDRAHFKDGKLPHDEDAFHISKLILFFKSSQFVASERHELYGPTDFLANFGGLLGLFTGFSILSLMEAIYFLTVRLCCNSRLYGYWAGPET